MQEELVRALVDKLSHKFLKISLLWLILLMVMTAIIAIRVSRWERILANEWLVQDMKTYSLEIQAKNPTLNLPNVDQILLDRQRSEDR
jgi:hypothetical protein